MAPARALQRRRLRLPRPDLGRLISLARYALTVTAVIGATLGAAYVALNTYSQTQNLSVGQVQLSIDPGHTGALDLYVPLVDWGVRFEDAIKLPVRLHVDLRTVDRGAVAKVANGGSFDLQVVRTEARDAIASYLINLVAITIACAAAMGLLVAFAVRHHSSPRLRYTTAAVGTTTAAIAAALILLLPPRGQI